MYAICLNRQNTVLHDIKWVIYFNKIQQKTSSDIM